MKILQDTTRPDEFHTIQVPRGGEYILILDDGTRVWMNSESELRYPVSFHGSERRVYLKGEAYFEVKHDEEHPFVVETFACDVRVLGTKFNVLAEKEAGLFETALMQGCVEVRSQQTGERITLRPDETVRLENNRLIRSSLADRDDYSWTSGYINLKGHTFTELIDRFRRAFDVRIELDGVHTTDTRFQWGKICVKDGIDNAMKVLQNAYPIVYEFDAENRTVTVRNK